MSEGRLFRERAKIAIEQYWQKQQSQVVLRVSGNSMGATLPDGSEVLVTFSECPVLRRNQIAYIRRGTHRIVHRLRVILGPICLEQGDARRLPRLCRRKDILGTVEVYKKNNG